MNTRALLISALVAGVLMGILSSIPIINLVNCLLCGWIWLGGIFAVWMYRSNAGVTPDTGRAAAIGALAGVVGAIVGSVIGGLLTMLGVGASAVPPETMRQLEEQLGEAARILASGTASFLISVLINLVLYPIFGALGGLIGSALFKGRA